MPVYLFRFRATIYRLLFDTWDFGKRTEGSDFCRKYTLIGEEAETKVLEKKKKNSNEFEFSLADFPRVKGQINC